MKEKQDKQETDVDITDIEKNIDEEIKNYIENFYVDDKILSKIHIPEDIKKEAIKPIKLMKKEKKKNIRYAILDMIIVLVCILPVVGVINPKIFKSIPQVYPVFYKINKVFKKDNIMSLIGLEEKRDPIEGDIESSKDTKYVKEKNVKTPTNNYEAIKLVHSLANTLIQAEYKWQCTEVTPKTIEKGIKGIEFIKDDYDRMHLRNSITKWSKGNFSNSVEVHNYVWEILDGSVGKAYTLDEKEIEKIINKYFNDKKS
ncbi:MAG: DUF6241 domain-containing protein [Terrisporobacter sp.]